MHAGNDAAEQAFKLTIEGTEMAVKIVGSGMKHIAAALYVLLKDNNKTRGALRLKSMMKQNPNAVVYSVRKEDMQQFVRSAKDYGILYCALKDRNKDGLIDVLVRPEDASRIDRIVQRFQLNAVSTDTRISAEQEPTAAPTPEAQAQEAQQTEDLLNSLLGEEPISQPEQEAQSLLDYLMEPEKKEETPENPTMAETGKSPLSEPFSEKSVTDKTGDDGRKSVRQDLQGIAAQQQSARKKGKNKGMER